MSKASYDVWAIVKDPGGINAVMPVARALKALDKRVLLIADGHASERLRGQDEFDQALPDMNFLLEQPLPRVVLTSMCSGGGIGRELIPHVRDKVHTVAVCDTWEFDNAWSDPKFWPEHIVVNDMLGEKVVRNKWVGYEGHVHMTGYPSLDQYASVDTQSAYGAVCRELGLGRGLPLVVFTGQGHRTGATLAEVVIVLRELGIDHYLIPRPHPRTKDDYATEMTAWQRALGLYKGRMVVDWFGACTTSELIAACANSRGVIVSMFSNTLVEAACVRAQAISVLYPTIALPVYQAAVPTLSQEPIALGCAAIADERKALVHHLGSALRGQLGIEAEQSRHFVVDGKSADRVAQLALSLM